MTIPYVITYTNDRRTIYDTVYDIDNIIDVIKEIFNDDIKKYAPWYYDKIESFEDFLNIIDDSCCMNNYFDIHYFHDNEWIEYDYKNIGEIWMHLYDNFMTEYDANKKR